MITNDPFREYLKEHHISTYALIHTYKFSHGLLDRLNKNLPITTRTINDICNAIGCVPSDILDFTPDSPD